jgi:hypothetical protein
MVFLFYFGLALLPLFWVSTIYFLRKWKYIKFFYIANTALVAIYFFLIFHAPLRFFKTDPLGLKNIFLFLYLVFFSNPNKFYFLTLLQIQT